MKIIHFIIFLWFFLPGIAQDTIPVKNIEGHVSYGSVKLTDDGFFLIAENERSKDIFQDLKEATGYRFRFIGDMDTVVNLDYSSFLPETLIDEVAWASGALAVKSRNIYFIYDRDETVKELTYEYIPRSMEYDKLIEQSRNIPFNVSLQGYSNHNSILIQGSAGEIWKTVQLLRQIDNLPRQVGIELLIVEYNHGNNFNWSFDLSSGKLGRLNDIHFNPSSSIEVIYNFIENLKPSFKVNLQALIEKNFATVVSNPHLLAANGETANLNIQQTQYFVLQTATINGLSTYLESVNTGIKMTIKPTIMGDDHVFLNVYGEVSSFIPDESAQQANNFISTQKNEISNEKVILKDGQTLIIGGLIQAVEDHFTGGVPILKDIPVLGWIFKRKVKVKNFIETVIYITPHIGDHSLPSAKEELESYDDLQEKMIEENRKNRKRNIRKLK